jgi:hypothetical protein
MRELAAPFIPPTTDASYAEAAKETRRVETKRRHALEVASKSLGAVQDLELKLGITARWEPGSEAWVKAAKMVSSRRYQRALDQLQGLVVARMFELSKVNMSGTGEICFMTRCSLTSKYKGTSYASILQKRCKRVQKP